MPDLSWLWIVPILGVLVLVHEAGHFFTARLFGIRVEEFGIGLPPRAFAIRRNGIDYSVNWLPIGGFVKILGENGDSEAPDSFGKAAWWKRVIVLGAGVTMNMITAVVLFFIFYMLGQTTTLGPPMIGAITDASGPAAVAGLQPNDIILQIEQTPLTSADQMKSVLDTRRGQPTLFTYDRDGQTKTTTVTPRAQGLALGIQFGGDQRGPMSVQQVDPNSTAAKNGLQPGDMLVAVNGRSVPTLDRLNDALNAAKGQATVSVVYSRKGASQPAIQAELNNGGLGGVVTVPPTTHLSYSPGEALSKTFDTIGSVLVAIPQQLGQMVSGQVPANSFAGPIGIAQITGEVSRQSGFQGLLSLTAILGVNLALINILPIPALDGGRILFVLIDAILVTFTRRRVPPQLEGMIHLVGMAILLLLILLISFGDVGRLLAGGSFLPK